LDPLLPDFPLELLDPLLPDFPLDEDEDGCPQPGLLDHPCQSPLDDDDDDEELLLPDLPLLPLDEDDDEDPSDGLLDHPCQEAETDVIRSGRAIAVFII